MPNILHLGIGNFHRAHQAWYTQKANELGGEPWRIKGVSLRRADMRDALAPQNFEYSLVLKSKGEIQFERVAIHDDIFVASENPQSIIREIANPQTKVITLTITEKGYCIDGSSGRLNIADPLVKEELATGQPKTAIGFIGFGLALRKQSGAEPVTIISCDNLPDNGRVLEKAVNAFSQAADLDLEEYLKASVSFPNTMVDRIVPATTDAMRDEVRTATGFEDAGPVFSEQFSEWVIEDRFAGPIPAWDKVGATIVEDVSPYELRKLRLLNGTHSLMAYSGLLAGHRFVHEAVADSSIRERVGQLMVEASATLGGADPSDLQDYCNALLERFENPALRHELAQIAMDGSLKLPIRILPVLKTIKTDLSESAAFHGVVSWAQFILGQLETGGVIGDPKEAAFRAMRQQSGDAQALAKSVLASLDPSLDGTDLSAAVLETLRK